MYGPRLAQDVLCRHICETPVPLPQKTIPNNFLIFIENNAIMNIYDMHKLAFEIVFENCRKQERCIIENFTTMS